MSDLPIQNVQEGSIKVKIKIETILLIITSIVSVVSLIFNVIQWKSNTDVDLREWRYEVSTFIIQHYDSIFGDDEEKRQSIRDVMLITFPEDIASVICERLAKVAKSRKEMSTWSEGLNQAGTINTDSVKNATNKKIILYIQYYNKGDADNVDYLTSVLKEKGYIVPEKELVEQKVSPEIRYYYDEDKEDAEKLKDEINKALQQRNINLEIKARYMKDITIKPIKGVMEFWL